MNAGDGAVSPLVSLDVDAPDVVHRTLDAVGRTEDARFSPSGRRLALAGFLHHSIALADVEVDLSGQTPRILVTAAWECPASSLVFPHGIDFLDEDTMVVANRHGTITLHRIELTGEEMVLTDLHIDDRSAPLHTPGSLTVTALGERRYEVLVCDNMASEVRRLNCELRDDHLKVLGAEAVVRRWVELPDGVAVSADLRWVAISSHENHTVLVYRHGSALTPHADPVAVLRGVLHPHGLRFSADGRHLFVTDAGTPLLHVFARVGDSWAGGMYPVASHAVVSDEQFMRQRYNTTEGGPKGIDLDPSGRVMVITSEARRLSFFDVEALLSNPVGASRATLGFEFDVLAETRALRDPRLAAAAARGLKRLDKPYRRMKGRVVRAVRRW